MDFYIVAGEAVALPYRAQDAEGMWWDDLANNSAGRTECGYTELAPAQPSYDPATQQISWQNGGWVVTALPSTPSAPIILDSLGYQMLYTSDERINMRKAAETDPQVADWVALASSPGNFDLSDPRLIAMVDGSVAKGLVTSARATQVLAGQAPPTS